MNYSLDIEKLIRRLIPYKRRKEQFVKWIYALCAPVNYLKGLFDTFRSDTDTLMRYTGQVIYLERALNDLFDPVAKGIYITDGSGIPTTFLYHVAENRDTAYIYHKVETDPAEDYLYHLAEGSGYYDFIIMVPTAVTFDAAYFNSIVERYKAAGKTYKVDNDRYGQDTV